jgi:hypothetical protein
MSLSRVTFKRLFPVIAVTGTVILAALAPSGSFASSTNNCGVKGGYAYGGYSFAFHDHGKPCPNRPFPGRGKGLIGKIAALDLVIHGKPTGASRGSSNSANTKSLRTTDQTTTGAPTPGQKQGNKKGHRDDHANHGNHGVASGDAT